MSYSSDDGDDDDDDDYFDDSDDSDNYGSNYYHYNSVTCYKCHKKGHFASQCYSNNYIRCYQCNQRGHIRPNCPQLRQTYSSTNFIIRPPQTLQLPQPQTSNQNTSTTIQNQILFKDSSLQQIFNSFTQKEREEQLEMMKQLDEVFSKPQSGLKEEIQKETSINNCNKDYITKENKLEKANQEIDVTNQNECKKSKKVQKNEKKANEKLEKLAQQNQQNEVKSPTDQQICSEKDNQQNQISFQFDALEFAKQLLKNTQN
ncbi:hypothetical protein ABPG72_012283 [Tetrahymena utriculariae]